MFQFTHPGKGATILGYAPRYCEYVSIHAPWEGCDYNTPYEQRKRYVSIHAPWEGCDLIQVVTNLKILRFNSRTLGRVRRSPACPFAVTPTFQFTHPGKGATPFSVRAVVTTSVSIHAPWEGCDTYLKQLGDISGGFNSRTLGRVRRSRRCRIGSRGCFNSRTLGRVRLEQGIVVTPQLGVSIHAPWEGCDRSSSASPSVPPRFQFTHPGKGATRSAAVWRRSKTFQFTHPGKGATSKLRRPLLVRNVSIHAPWEGCDAAQIACKQHAYVSIHAPWEGCDGLKRPQRGQRRSFNSRTLGRVRLSLPCCVPTPRPCFNSRTLGRVRLVPPRFVMSDQVFQFTHPGKGATPYYDVEVYSDLPFQFTHPGKGATPFRCMCDDLVGFQFTHPGKGATVGFGDLLYRLGVSIHAPWEGCDLQVTSSLVGV